MEWNQCSGGRSQQLLESQQSYETEWDMVNTVSFKKRPGSNTEGNFFFNHLPPHFILVSVAKFPLPVELQNKTSRKT